MDTLSGNIAGSATLEQQETTLNDTERGGGLNLVSFEISEQTGLPEHKNTATFDFRDSGHDEIPMLKLVEVPDNKTKSEVKKGFPDKQELFTTDVWVTDVIKKVLVLR